ncbi:MAG: chorismate mutase [Candidatus Bathyarchaeia archaeon]
MEKVPHLRRKIDEIDEKILLLLKDRIDVSKLIGKIKRENAVPIRDLQREEEKYRHIMQRASELGLDLDEVKNIYKSIMAMSIHAQENSQANGA